MSVSHLSVPPLVLEAWELGGGIVARRLLGRGGERLNQEYWVVTLHGPIRHQELTLLHVSSGSPPLRKLWLVAGAGSCDFRLLSETKPFYPTFKEALEGVARAMRGYDAAQRLSGEAWGR